MEMLKQHYNYDSSCPYEDSLDLVPCQFWRIYIKINMTLQILF